jgi:WD40 repeat protein
MGIVYRARQKSLNRLVAVKMIRPDALATPAARARFRAEAENAATLDHPNIVPLHEVGEHGGMPFYSMKLIEGGTVVAREGPWLAAGADRNRAAARLLEKVAQAVHHAHERGILHRDLKPGNILIDSAGQPHVTDFGLAKRIDNAVSLTDTGAIVGTPAYMAPEQAMGQKALTIAADVYALGAILYELLTGRPPFKGDHILETLRQTIETEVSPPRLYNPQANRDLEVICLKCLQKHPAKRYGSAEALAQDLERWLAGEPILARPVGRLERMVKWVGRNKGLSAGLAATVLALLVGTAVATWQAVVASIAAENEAQQRQAAVAEKDAAEAAHKETEKALLQVKKELFRFQSMHYIDHIAAADKALQNNDFVAARWHLGECRPEFRHVEYAYLSKQLAQKAPRELLGHTSSVDSLVLSPDGKRLYSGSVDSTIKVWDLEAGKETLTLRGRAGGVTSLALSPDGKRLFSGSGDAIKVWNLETGKEILSLRGHTGWVTSLALSSDGKRLCSAGGVDDKTIKVWDLEAGKETLTLRGHEFGVSSLALSPDGKRLCSGSQGESNSGEIKVWDLEAGKEIITLRGHTSRVISLALSPDGKRLCSGSGGFPNPAGEIKVWDLEASKELITLRGHTGRVLSLALSPDGKRLCSGSYDATIKVWDLEAGKETFTLPGHEFGWLSLTLALSPDGKRLFSGSGDAIKVWDLETGKEILTLRVHTDAVYSLALSSDGKRLFSGSGDTTIKVWNLETGKETLTLRGHTGRVLSLALSPDGKRLFSAGLDNTIKVWDLETGKEPLTLRGHTDAVTSLALSSDGKRLFSGSDDHTW